MQRASDPVMGVPAVDEPGTVAVTVRSPLAPGGNMRLVGLSRKAEPTRDADTTRLEPPMLVIVSALLTGVVAPLETAPRSRVVEENAATGGPLFPSANVASLAPPSFLPPSPSGRASPVVASLERASPPPSPSSGATLALSSPPPETAREHATRKRATAQ